MTGVLVDVVGGAALVGLLTSGEEDPLFCTEETIVVGTGCLVTEKHWVQEIYKHLWDVELSCLAVVLLIHYVSL